MWIASCCTHTEFARLGRERQSWPELTILAGHVIARCYRPRRPGTLSEGLSVNRRAWNHHRSATRRIITHHSSVFCFVCLINHHWSSVISDAHQINPSTSDLRSRNCARQVGLERRSGYREVLSSRYRCRWLSLRFVQCKEMRSTVRCPNTSGLVSSQWIHLEARHISFDRT